MSDKTAGDEWGLLPKDPMQLIASSLRPADLLAARRCCAHWRAHLTDALTGPSTSPTTTAASSSSSLFTPTSELYEINTQAALPAFQSRVASLAAIFPSVRAYQLHIGSRTTAPDLDAQLRAMADTLQPSLLDLRHVAPVQPLLGAPRPQLHPALAAFAPHLRCLRASMGLPTEPQALAAALLPLTRLSELRLTGIPSEAALADAHLEVISQMSGLETLELELSTGTPFDAGLARLCSGLPHLTSLHLHNALPGSLLHGGAAAVATLLAPLTRLRDLRLQLPPTHLDTALAALLAAAPASLDRLFVLAHQQLRPEGLEGVEYSDEEGGEGPHPGDAVLAAVLGAPRYGLLAGLTLTDFAITAPDFLRQLGRLTGLEELDLAHASCGIELDGDLRLLAPLTRLRSLSVAQMPGCNVPALCFTPAAVDVLTLALTNLASLSLLNAGMNGHACAAIGRFPALRTLALQPRSWNEHLVEHCALFPVHVARLPSGLTSLRLIGAELVVPLPVWRTAVRPATAAAAAAAEAVAAAGGASGSRSHGVADCGIAGAGGGGGGDGGGSGSGQEAPEVDSGWFMQLEDLALVHCQVRGGRMRRLCGRLPRLRSLELYKVVGFHDEVAPELAALTGLTSLCVHGRDIFRLQLYVKPCRPVVDHSGGLMDDIGGSTAAHSFNSNSDSELFGSSMDAAFAAKLGIAHASSSSSSSSDSDGHGGDGGGGGSGGGVRPTIDGAADMLDGDEPYVRKELSLAGLVGLSGLRSLRWLRWMVAPPSDSPKEGYEAECVGPLTALRALQVLQLWDSSHAPAARARTVELLRHGGLHLCDTEAELPPWEHGVPE